jgi:hypothetical protein
MRCLHFIILACFMPFSVFGQIRIDRIVPSADIQLRDPSAISVASDGTLLIIDTGHNRILAADSSGALLSEVGSLGSGQGEFRWPKDIASESALAIWVADFGNRRICKLSRQFNVLGSFSVSAADNSTSEQFEKIAATQQGDVYLYAEDSGRLLRYDPLFVLQATLGSTVGSAFIPRIRQLICIPDRGVIWHCRGDKSLSTSDPLLTSRESISIGLDSLDDYVFCASALNLLAAGSRGIFQAFLDGEPPRMLIDEEALKNVGVKQIDDIAAASKNSFYFLESKSGSIYRVMLETH